VICGVEGVAVKMGVGDNVAVGVRVGVNAAVGDCAPVSGMSGSAVCVNAATTVCAMVVPIKLESDVGTAVTDEVHAREAINKADTAKETGFNFNIFTCFRLTASIIIPKSMVIPLSYRRLQRDFVPRISEHERMLYN
jgi:hypothetical protein